MNNILIINYFFGDDRVPTARMVNDVAKELKKKNINFKIFCSKTNYKYLKNSHKKKLFEINSIKFFDFKFLIISDETPSSTSTFLLIGKNLGLSNDD